MFFRFFAKCFINHLYDLATIQLSSAYCSMQLGFLAWRNLRNTGLVSERRREMDFQKFEFCQAELIRSWNYWCIGSALRFFQYSFCWLLPAKFLRVLSNFLEIAQKSQFKDEAQISQGQVVVSKKHTSQMQCIISNWKIKFPINSDTHLKTVSPKSSLIYLKNKYQKFF